MSDILSDYYNAQYCINNSKNINKNYLTPNKNLKIKQDTTALNLSPYGIYLSENNALLISNNNKMSPLSIKYSNTHNFLPLPLNKKLKSQTIKYNSGERTLSLTSNFNKHKKNIDSFDDPKLKKCFSYKRKSKILLQKIGNLNNKEALNKKNIKTFIINQNEKKDNNLKSRNNNIEEFSILKKGFNNYPNNTISYCRTLSNISKRQTYYKTIHKEKNENLFYKETKKDKLNNRLEAEKIIKELLNLKTKKDIKSYYIKKDYAQSIADAEKNNNNQNCNINRSIDPMTYIKFNFSNYPKNNALFKSFDSQVMIMGNKKYRNDLVDGVNLYKNNIVKYKDLRGPIGFDKNRINEKKRNEIIKKMKKSYIKGNGFNFSNRLYKQKYNKKSNYEFDDNYKKIEKFLYKDIDKYEAQLYLTNGKKVDKKDINILKKMSDDAEYIIHDKEEMVKFSNRFLSFNERINKLLSKTTNTTNYLCQRAKEHHKIKKKIDKIYNDI